MSLFSRYVRISRTAYGFEGRMLMKIKKIFWGEKETEEHVGKEKGKYDGNVCQNMEELINLAGSL